MHAGANAKTTFVDPGPWTVTPLPPFAVPRELSETTMRAAAGNIAAAVAAASLDETVDATVDVYVPSGGGGGGALARPKGVAVVLPGFLLSARRSYRTLAAHLASHGFAAALVDVDDPSASDAAMARACAASAAAAASRVAAAAAGPGQQQQQQRRPPPLPVLLIGHSRGAKVAALAAAGWDRLAPRGNGSVGPAAPPPLRGLVLLDPVDRATLGPPPGPSYPSSLPSVRQLAARGEVPILVVGAGDNGDIVEAASGWQSFVAAAGAGAAEGARARAAATSSSPSASGGESGQGARVLELLLPRARHLDFADTQSDPLVGGLLGLFGGSGGQERPAAEAVAVRRCADAAAAFWASLACGMVGAEGGKGGASLAAVEAEAAALRRLLVPDARWRVMAWGGEAGGAGGGGGGAGTDEANGWPAGAAASREELSALRASQLQAMLRDRGVYYGDCFEKAELVDRVLSSSAAPRL